MVTDVGASLLVTVGLVWFGCGGYEIIKRQKPPGILGRGILHRNLPEPELTRSQWLRAGIFLAVLGLFIVGVGVELASNWNL